ncbi:MAG TPA: glycosyl hydrolase, partial [Tepidisphaeraceae bacterium]|nr:glycosyl hydrolase [Tepidisphaeraceae bacterium]
MPNKLVLPLLLLLASTAVAQTTAPSRRLPRIPIVNLSIDAKSDQGPLELWRHTLGQGGVNSNPLSPRVIEGTKPLHPRLVRIFLQEFFNIYPDHGKYDWSKLDPYMDSFAATGAKVVAAITIKPKVLYPQIDQKIWRPNNVQEWQQVIAALVKRYSIDKPIVTYWEIGNETDIGENGGCPYLITDPAEYVQYYKMTIEPILKTFPDAKVGGTAVANAGGQYLPQFIDHCLKEKLRLDFISWHLYSDDPDAHARLVTKYKKLLESFGAKRPEMLVTEWSKNFDAISVQELAVDPRRAAIIASSIIAMTDAGLDWSFYYHLTDQHVRLDEFRPFFKDLDIMYHHWNEVPHRFG